MVAFKKSIALAAFAVAGVNANGCTECCSSSTGKNEVIPDANENEDSNSDMVEKPTKPDSGVADAPVVEQTKCQKAQEKAQEAKAAAAAEWNSMTEAAKARYENFAAFVAEKKATISETTSAVKNGANAVKDSTKSKYQSLKEMLKADNRFYNQTFAVNKQDAKATAQKAFRGTVDTAKAGVDTLKENKVAAISTTLTVTALSGAWVFADKLHLENQKKWIVDTINSTLQSVSTPEERAALKEKFFTTMASLKVGSLNACTSCMENTVSLKNKSVQFSANMWASLTKDNFLATVESMKAVPAEMMVYMGELYNNISGWTAEHKAEFLGQLREKKEWTKESVSSLFANLSTKFGYNKTA